MKREEPGRVRFEDGSFLVRPFVAVSLGARFRFVLVCTVSNQGMSSLWRARNVFSSRNRQRTKHCVRFKTCRSVHVTRLR